MGQESKSKALRKQLRNIVQEILPAVLESELKTKMYEEFSKNIHNRIDLIAKNVQETMSKIDERTKDVQSYMVRQVTSPIPAKEPDVTAVAEAAKE